MPRFLLVANLLFLHRNAIKFYYFSIDWFADFLRSYIVGVQSVQSEGGFGLLLLLLLAQKVETRKKALIDCRRIKVKILFLLPLSFISLQKTFPQDDEKHPEWIVNYEKYLRIFLRYFVFRGLEIEICFDILLGERKVLQHFPVWCCLVPSWKLLEKFWRRKF